jgi:hypothetical protein
VKLGDAAAPQIGCRHTHGNFQGDETSGFRRMANYKQIYVYLSTDSNAGHEDAKARRKSWVSFVASWPLGRPGVAPAFSLTVERSRILGGSRCFPRGVETDRSGDTLTRPGYWILHSSSSRNSLAAIRSRTPHVIARMFLNRLARSHVVKARSLERCGKPESLYVNPEPS